MEKFIEGHNLSVNKKMELTSTKALKQSLLADLSYSIVPVMEIKNEFYHCELQIIPAKGLPIITTWSLIWLKGKKPSPVSQSLLEYMKKNKSQIRQEKFGWYEQY
jgi:hypothetical protein